MHPAVIGGAVWRAIASARVPLSNNSLDLRRREAVAKTSTTTSLTYQTFYAHRQHGAKAQAS
jgi:hypothetical protein